jgi:hypothetical protein
MLAVVATHGFCFDGLCSAVLFTQLLRHLRHDKPYSFRYHSMTYGPQETGVDPKLLCGDENAILDYRFSPSNNLQWYFDHHVSAFGAPGDREVFEAAVREKTLFHDVAYGSCTKLIADVGREKFGLDVAPFQSMIDWADMIDRAAFPSAEMAVSRKEPVMQLMTVVEHMGNDSFLGRMVVRLLLEKLEDVARASDIQALYAPIHKAHLEYVEHVKQLAKVEGEVVYVDLTEVVVEAPGKFVTYALYPEKPYSVYVTRGKKRCKISVGYNPWCGAERKHNIAAICERFGGGGHPVVGAVSTTSEEVERAKQIAREITEELKS